MLLEMILPHLNLLKRTIFQRVTNLLDVNQGRCLWKREVQSKNSFGDAKWTSREVRRFHEMALWKGMRKGLVTGGKLDFARYVAGYTQ